MQAGWPFNHLLFGEGVEVKTLEIADLFAGAGGTSTGVARAAARLGARMNLIAVNHWEIAVETHTQNHPDAKHFCTDLDATSPRKLVPSGRLNLLVASPECTHHSNARGGKPMSDQSRSTAWCILRWCEALYVENVLIENVREFLSWGPLGANGRPLISKRGETFKAFIAGMCSLGYRVEHRILNAANYGDPTTRERLFIIARRGNKPIKWPVPSHSVDGRPSYDKQKGGYHYGEFQKWRSARQIIDWDLRGRSIFGRKKPLAQATLDRIAAGLIKFGGKNAEPFLVMLRNHGSARSVDLPVPCVTAGGKHVGLCEPFVAELRGGKTANSINDPLSTVATRGAHHALIEPFILGQQSGSVARSTGDPLPTVATDGAISLVQPFIVPQFGERAGQSPRVHSIDEPAPTVTGHGAGALVEPFITRFNGSHEGRDDGSGRNSSIESPLSTVDTSNRFGLVESFIVPQFGEALPRSLDRPLSTITTTSRGIGLVEPFMMTCAHGGGDEKNHARRTHDLGKPVPTLCGKGEKVLIEPYLVQYNGTADSRPISEPLGSVTTRDRFGLVSADGYAIDILFRMLQPHELAAAQGFPPGYIFVGNREQQVKQIGNAVCVNLAEALAWELLQ